MFTSVLLKKYNKLNNKLQLLYYFKFMLDNVS